MSGLVKVPKISLLATALLALVLLASQAVAEQRPFNLGQIATAKQVAGWDIDVRPDGLGAPVGAGNAFDGEEVYAELCASCHGDFGEAVDSVAAVFVNEVDDCGFGGISSGTLEVSMVEFARLDIGIVWPITSSDASNSPAMSTSREEFPLTSSRI